MITSVCAWVENAETGEGLFCGGYIKSSLFVNMSFKEHTRPRIRKEVGNLNELCRVYTERIEVPCGLHATGD